MLGNHARHERGALATSAATGRDVTLYVSVASTTGPAFGRFDTLMWPPIWQAHGVTRTVA